MYLLSLEEAVKMPLRTIYNQGMNDISPYDVLINDRFWTPRLKVNAERAVFHQWKMLEDSRCIDNFRIAAGDKSGFREGWFFADSDAYKWLDAAARVYSHCQSAKLKQLMDDFIFLLERTQLKDGYIFTYNQVHFPNHRWDNLMIEHELYCHGHLIEACISHHEATGERTAMDIARCAADMLVHEFLVSTPDKTSGHEEIEIALLRLHKATGCGHYIELARQFIERRGRIKPFAFHIYRQHSTVSERLQFIREQRKLYLAEHSDQESFQLFPNNYAKKTRNSTFRWQLSGLTGKYFQMHTPIRKQSIPTGHAVRFAYLETAIAMLYRLDGDQTLLPAMKKAWERMVNRRMYITGGIGSLPELEGFGKDFELDPEIAYAETCAALGSLFWNWEMVQITGDARYSDLFEWQLYNAAAVGMGLSGEAYLYNNPLTCRGGITRRPWFQVPCCPSNLSRTWAGLGKYIFSAKNNELWIHQYIGSEMEVDLGVQVRINLQASFPWEGRVRLMIDPETSSDLTLHLRIPSWVDLYHVRINGKTHSEHAQFPFSHKEIPASGYDPHQASFLHIRRIWSRGDILEINFSMQTKIRHASPKLKGHKGKIAITRGPLVYCLESVDNPDVDIFTTHLDETSLKADFLPTLLGGTQVISGKTKDGKNLRLIPYMLWANRGESQMLVWVNT